jgi:hypothetical protein
MKYRPRNPWLGRRWAGAGAPGHPQEAPQRPRARDARNPWRGLLRHGRHDDPLDARNPCIGTRRRRPLSSIAASGTRLPLVRRRRRAAEARCSDGAIGLYLGFFPSSLTARSADVPSFLRGDNEGARPLLDVRREGRTGGRSHKAGTVRAPAPYHGSHRRIADRPHGGLPIGHMGQYHEQHKRHKRAAQPTPGEVQLVQQNSDERYLR